MANPAGVLFGVDVSHHQEGLDVGKLPIDYVIARTAQAPGGKYGLTRDRYYAQHKANAERGGKLFSSYFYLGNGRSAEGNVSLHAEIEPDRKIPVMLDWEEGSGNGNLLHAAVGAFAQAGYHVWGTYAPRWYWQSQGSPDLSGLPPLVSSRYPDMAPGTLANEYASTPESYWLGYGNNVVRMLQFSSAVRFAAYPSNNFDGDAFKGTHAELADWWNPGTPNPVNPITPGDDVSLIRTIRVKASPTVTGIQIPGLPGGPNCKFVVRPPGFDWTTRTTATPVWQNNVLAYGNRNQGIGHNPMNDPNFDKKLTADTEIPLPGALNARYEYSANADFDLDIYG